MRLVSFRIPTPLGPRVRIGAIAPDGATVVDLTLAYATMLRAQDATVEAATRIADALLPADMVAFLGGGERALDDAREALDWAWRTGTSATPDGAALHHGPGTIKLLAPVPRPPLLRDFMAFETHLTNIYPRLGRAIPDEWYQLPVYYKGNPGSVAGDGEAIAIPPYAAALDFEFELAFVIGTGGIDIPPERALEHVVGFTIYNDFSERVIQAREMAVGLGLAKGKDFVNGHVFGPALVTMDEIPDPYDMAMSARVNDEVWCEANSSSIHWRFEQLIAHASRGERLAPGEIFGSGTVGGGARAETGRSLMRGDRIALTVDPLGTLRNTID